MTDFMSTEEEQMIQRNRAVEDPRREDERRIGFTPKGFHNKAQGQRRSRATLGCDWTTVMYPEGVPQLIDSWFSGRFSIVQPLQGWAFISHTNPGCAHFVRDPGLCCETPLG